MALNAWQQSEATVVLQDGTPIKLRLGRTVSSADAHVGDPVDFRVIEDVKVGATTFIARGSVALGTVTEVKGKHRLARGGKLSIRIDFVWLADRSKVPLRATKEARGGDHTGLMTGAMLGTGLVFLPAAPAFVLMRGQDSTLLKGTEVTAYVHGDASIDSRNLQLQRSQESRPPAQLSAELNEIINLLPSR